MLLRLQAHDLFPFLPSIFPVLLFVVPTTLGIHVADIASSAFWRLPRRGSFPSTLPLRPSLPPVQLLGTWPNDALPWRHHSLYMVVSLSLLEYPQSQMEKLRSTPFAVLPLHTKSFASPQCFPFDAVLLPRFALQLPASRVPVNLILIKNEIRVLPLGSFFIIKRLLCHQETLRTPQFHLLLLRFLSCYRVQIFSTQVLE